MFTHFLLSTYVIIIILNGGNMSNYKCTVCGYTYKPERGDWMHDIPKNTAFEDLPESWRCPSCNQPMMAFEEIKE